jgi:hypothetical protein
MTAKPRVREPRSRKPSSSSDVTERIRQRAYDLYEQRGKGDGLALDDWLQAESEIRGTKKPGSKSKQTKEWR